MLFKHHEKRHATSSRTKETNNNNCLCVISKNEHININNVYFQKIILRIFVVPYFLFSTYIIYFYIYSRWDMLFSYIITNSLLFLIRNIPIKNWTATSWRRHRLVYHLAVTFPPVVLRSLLNSTLQRKLHTCQVPLIFKEPSWFCRYIRIVQPCFAICFDASNCSRVFISIVASHSLHQSKRR